MTTRRTVVAVAACLTAGLAAPAGVAATTAAGDARALARLLAHRESARAVGRAYLRTRPAESDAAGLVARITADPGVARALGTAAAGDAALARALDRAIRADFTARRTVKVEGWVLAATEARLCALTTLA